MINSDELLQKIREEPYDFLQKNKGKEYVVQGRLSNYQPLIDVLWLNEKPNRIVFIFDPGSVGSKYQQTDLPVGSLIQVKGKLNFIQYFTPYEPYPAFVKSELVEVVK